jgi:hypothetical protein
LPLFAINAILRSVHLSSIFPCPPADISFGAVLTENLTAMRKNLLMLIVSIMTFAAACKKENTEDRPPVVDPDDKPVLPTGVPTETGKPIGPKITRRIGTSGGTFSLAYGRVAQLGSGRFEIQFPQGCFEKEVEISIQPIENMCHNGTGPGLRFTASEPGIKLKKPAELTLIEDKAPTPNDPEIYIAVQDPVIKVWRGGRGTKEAGGRRKFKLDRLADWALFQNYHLVISDFGKHARIADSINGDRISLISWQPIELEVKRITKEEDFIPVADNSDLFMSLPAPVNIAQDQIEPVKWKFNGTIVTGPSSEPIIKEKLGHIRFSGLKLQTMIYTAPVVLPDADTPLDVQIESEVRGKNNGPVMILIGRFRVTNPNEFRLNGVQAKNAFAQAEGNQVFTAISLSAAVDPNPQAIISFFSTQAPQTQAYTFTQENENIHTLQGASKSPDRTWEHKYTDRQNKKHFSGGNLTITSIKHFSKYRIISGTISSTMYDYNRSTDELHTTTASGKFQVVDMEQ